ncbi:MAG TPA: hypothetical protein VHS59_09795 [Bacillota bacterium]|nr:hypothetical protein [Bacillota bacterium]
MECESKRIGRLIVPEIVTKAMAEGRHILLYASLPKRVERSVELYCGNPEYKPALCRAVESIAQRLGRKKAEELIDQIDQDNYHDSVEYLLVNYYDPLYKYPNQPSEDYQFSVCTDDLNKAAEEIAHYVLNS